MSNEYECGMSGLVERAGYEDDSDGLGDLPIGWTRVQITRRQVNPKWLLINQVKNTMVDQLVSQFPPEQQELQRYAISTQVEAQFYGLESNTPMYLPDVDDVVYISDSPDIAEDLNDLRESLGLDPLSTGADENDADQDDSDEDDDADDDDDDDADEDGDADEDDEDDDEDDDADDDDDDDADEDDDEDDDDPSAE